MHDGSVTELKMRECDMVVHIYSLDDTFTALYPTLDRLIITGKAFQKHRGVKVSGAYSFIFSQFSCTGGRKS